MADLHSQPSFAELDVSRRQLLANAVVARLQADPRVHRVEYTGSLETGTAGVYSDIDVIAHISSCSDREFFFLLPDMMREVGPLVIEGWGFGMLPDVYVGTFYFEGYPLFWHVDIGCLSEQHVDGSDLIQIRRWEQPFKMWVNCVRDMARAQKSIVELKAIISRRNDVSHVAGRPEEQLGSLLEVLDDRNRNEGTPYERVFELCDELRHRLLS